MTQEKNLLLRALKKSLSITKESKKNLSLRTLKRISSTSKLKRNLSL